MCSVIECYILSFYCTQFAYQHKFINRAEYEAFNISYAACKGMYVQGVFVTLKYMRLSQHNTHNLQFQFSRLG